MATYILIIIYLAFISLGLPDSLLGVTWPVMRLDLNASLATAGIISMTVSGGTIISSLFSGKVLRRFGTGKVTTVSVLMTAGALLGFSFAPSLFWLVLLAIPLGLGAGSVDAGLNAYVAAHYKSHHMSWLHCFWGIGAMTGPIIMSLFMDGENTWRKGYLTVAIIQIVLVIILFLTLPLWKKAERPITVNNKDFIENVEDKITTNNLDSNPAYSGSEILEHESNHYDSKGSNPVKLKGVKLVLLTFLLYCGIESTLGLWGSSFLVNVKGINVSVAAKWIGMFYGGITLGRFFSGFLTLKLSNKMLIRIGEVILLIGAILLILPLHDYLSLLGFILAGLGCAPIYPCMLHETPVRFGKENSQNLMGIQMAVAYTGATFLPPIFGLAASYTTLAIFPFVILAYVTIMLLNSEKINLFFLKNKA